MKIKVIDDLITDLEVYPSTIWATCISRSGKPRRVHYDRVKDTFNCEDCIGFQTRLKCRHCDALKRTLIEKELIIVKTDWKKINGTLRKHDIDISQRKNINHFIFFHVESKAHRRAKFNKCEELFDSGHNFIYEALSSKNKRRYDLIDLTDDIIYEFETVKNVKKKGAKTVSVNIHETTAEQEQ